jgi:hypothetical protein
LPGTINKIQKTETCEQFKQLAERFTSWNKGQNPSKTEGKPGSFTLNLVLSVYADKPEERTDMFHCGILGDVVGIGTMWRRRTGLRNWEGFEMKQSGLNPDNISVFVCRNWEIP